MTIRNEDFMQRNGIFAGQFLYGKLAMWEGMFVHSLSTPLLSVVTPLVPPLTPTTSSSSTPGERKKRATVTKQSFL